MMTLLIAAVTAVGLSVAMPAFLGLLRAIGAYAIVDERRANVYILFGKVLGTLDEPGIYCLWKEFGAQGFLVNLFGSARVVDLRLDQEYLRSLPVNSEEGAPMGIGVWSEFWVSDPLAFLFKNADPRGSLRANVSNAAVRTLSNMKLDQMLVTRHEMSQAVREEVSPKSHEWGYKLGSVYIRKVHFRDTGMIRQIEEKVVNRLRQVTSAIRQDGTNQVNIIKSTAERDAAVEFAKAAIMRPEIVGQALQKISEDPEVFEALFDVLETQKLIEGDNTITLLPADMPREVLPQLLAANPTAVAVKKPPTS
jgi:regulator of protease activity HflC (stomatin/prohibitin superfamily)